jgi:hypothetical protein
MHWPWSLKEEEEDGGIRKEERERKCWARD